MVYRKSVSLNCSGGLLINIHPPPFHKVGMELGSVKDWAGEKGGSLTPGGGMSSGREYGRAR